jgi:penicillin-binding protein 2
VSEANTGRRITVIGIIVFALFAGLGTRLWFLQVAGGQQLAVQAQQNRDRPVTVPPLRGTIYDRNGVVLAQTMPVTTLTVDRQKLTPVERLTLEDNLGNLLGITAQQVDKLVDTTKYAPYLPVPVASNLTEAQSVYVAEHRDLFPETAITRTAVRTYPQGALGATVLGYTGQVSQADLTAHAGEGYTPNDMIGKAGVEQLFESQLRGTPGTDNVQVDSQGRAVDTVEVKKPVAGEDVVLSLDANVQRMAQESLQQGMDGAHSILDRSTGTYEQASGGAVIVMDARSGELLALASAPTFDPNAFVTGTGDKYVSDPGKPLVDRAVSTYAPGSTFKTFSSIAMLQSGIHSPGYTVDDVGCFKFGNDEQRCNAGHNSYGYVDLPRALTVSSDYYFYSLGNDFWNVYTRQEGGDNSANHPVGYAIQNVAKTYGFGENTGSGLDQNTYSAGRIPDLAFNQDLNKSSADATSRTWRRGDSASLAVGQGDVLVTPLQLADAYAAFANGGILYQPRLAKSLNESSAGLPSGKLGAVTHALDPIVRRQTGLSPDVRDSIMQGLQGVVDSREGTAYYAFQGFDSLPIAGKTGTAQVTNGQDTSWFVGMTNPQNDPNLPQYVVVSMVEQGGFGASVSAPIVRRVLEYLGGNSTPPPVGTQAAEGNGATF